MATTRICSIPHCGKPHFGRGWCAAHWKRWKKYGDPLGGGTGDGEPEKFLREVVIPYEGDDCLLWPFARTCGYGVVRHNGSMKRVSRLVCERAHGQPPTPMHEAAHSCGKGHEGCVTKRHLSWKTPGDNTRDKIAHGTMLRGEAIGNAKLSEADVLAIRSSRGALSQREIAKIFGVSQGTVSLIHTGKIWAHLP